MNLPRQRLSRPALVTTGLLHLALLWLVLQSAPVQQAVRRVVTYLAPITLPREKAPVPQHSITPKPAPPPLPVPKAEPKPIPPPAVITPPKAIELPPQKPPEPKKLPPVEPAPVPTPPAPTPLPEPTPPAPVPEPVPTPEHAAVPTPPAPVPPAPAPPAPAPAPPAPTPVPAPVPTPAAPRPAAITPVEQAPALPQTQGAGIGAAPTGAVKMPSVAYPNSMKSPPRQKSLSEMANEQIGGSQRRDRLADGVSDAELPDCIRPGGSLLSLITIPVAAATGKCKPPK